MKRMAGTCMLLAILGGCTNFRHDPPCADGSCADMRQQTPPAASQTRWSQREVAAAPRHTEELAITRMGPVDPPPPSQTTRPAMPTATASGLLPVRSGMALSSPGSQYTGSTTATSQKPTAIPEKTSDLVISHLPPSSSGERPAGRVMNMADMELTTKPSKPTSAQTTTELKPTAATTTDLSGGPSLEVGDSRPGKPRELKPGMDELANPKPLTPPTQTASRTPSGPVVRLVNKKRITLNYEVKDIGPSGVSGVELWYTRDAKDWKRHESAPETRPPYIIEVQEEGLYGFTLLAKNGIGLSKDPPHRGDLPQVWVEVDLAKPTVSLTDVKAGYNDKSPSLTVQWKANDKNLGGQPITVSYAEKEDGPWQPMASSIENSGRAVCPLRPGIPPKFFVRVEAKDLAGNVGLAQTPTAVQVDTSRPTVHILEVEAGSR